MTILRAEQDKVTAARQRVERARESWTEAAKSALRGDADAPLKATSALQELSNARAALRSLVGR